METDLRKNRRKYKRIIKGRIKHMGIGVIVAVSIMVGMIIEFMIRTKDEVSLKNYEHLLNKYENLSNKLYKTPYIGATYSNGYSDVTVFNFDKDIVRFISNNNQINYLDIELFNEQFKLKDD